MRKKNDGLLEFRPKDNGRNKRKSSSAWDAFHLIYDMSNEGSIVNDFVKCIKCDQFLSYKGPTTTQLLRHKCKAKQPTIDSFISVKRMNFTEFEINSVRESAMQFVVKDIRPFYAVEGCGLRNLCRSLITIGQKYPQMVDDDIERLIPHRTVIKEHVIEKANTVKKMIMDDFRKALEFPGYFACTTDLWTDDFRQVSYLCLTAHINIFENDKIRHKRYVYHVNSIDAMSKTAGVISKEIKAVLQNFGVTEENMENRIFWTTDRGGNIRAAFSRCKRLNCYAHMMNNIVEHMCKDEDARKTIKDAAALVKFMKSSGLNSKLKHSLKSYTETRWNTVYDCINSIDANYSDVLALLFEKENASNRNVDYVQRLSCLPRQIMQDMAQFLSIFKMLTDEIEGEKLVTIHRIWPAFIRINKLMEDDISDSTVIRGMKSIGRDYISSIHGDFLPTIEHKIGVFLHPMLKGLRMATQSEKEEIYSAVRALFNQGSDSIGLNMDQFESQSESRGHGMDVGTGLFVDFITENEQSSHDELQRYIEYRLRNVSRIIKCSHICNSFFKMHICIIMKNEYSISPN